MSAFYRWLKTQRGRAASRIAGGRIVIETKDISLQTILALPQLFIAV